MKVPAVLVSVLLSVCVVTSTTPASTPTDTLEQRAYSAGANVNVDVVKAIEGIGSAVTAANDRAGVVKAAVNQAYYAGKGEYNVGTT